MVIKVITIRVMWTDESEKENAIKLVNQITHCLSQLHLKKSKTYRNRRNNGGRIYITVKKQVPQ